jgi:nucleoside 2-deoxyribosyltransferase
MSSTKFLGEDWSIEHTQDGGIDHLILENSDIGRIRILESDERWNFDKKEYYKVLALIHEQSIFGRTYFLTDSINDELKQRTDLILCRSKEEMLNDFPANIGEVQKRVLMVLHKKYPKYGQEINEIMTCEYFAEDADDLIFILETLRDNGFINVNIKKIFDDVNFVPPITITENGWIEIEKPIQHDYSKQVFIAMSFDDTMLSAYLAIEKAVKECDFIPVRIDRVEHNNEISSEILYEIGKSHFVISDVTGHKNGVYFEAGFAMGQKKPIIWSCRKDDFGKVHFDTRQYNHILWKDEKDLYKKMKDRIMGTIMINDDDTNRGPK